MTEKDDFERDVANFFAALEEMFGLEPVVPPTQEEWKGALLWITEAHIMRDKWLYNYPGKTGSFKYWQKELETRSCTVSRLGQAAGMHNGKIKWDMRVARRAIEGGWVETFEPTLEKYNPKQIEWYNRNFKKGGDK